MLAERLRALHKYVSPERAKEIDSYLISSRTWPALVAVVEAAERTYKVIEPLSHGEALEDALAALARALDEKP